MSDFNNFQGQNVSWADKTTIPWHSLSRFVYPRTMEEVFAWAEELWNHHGLYSRSIQKAVRYFMTEVEVYGEGVEYEERRKYSDVIQANFDLLEDVAVIGDDFVSLGNSFTSLYVPFQRHLICSGCGITMPLRQLLEEEDAKALKWTNYEFTGECPNCGRKVTYKVQDQPLPEEQLKPRIIRWPPQYISLKWHPLSQTREYQCRVSEYKELAEGIKKGDPLFLLETPWEFIEALKHNKPLVFDQDELYHMHIPSQAIAQPNHRGWGLPLFMDEFETALLVMMLDKYTEAVAVDYLIPFRVIAPPKLAGAEDPLMSVDMGGFMGHVRRMIDAHRQNPTTWHTMPFPMEYQTLGGEASQLVPIELQQHFEKRLLHSMGIPEEFQSSSFQTAAPVIAFRLFERSWQFFANALNKWLTWLIKRQGQLLSWESVRGRLLPVSVYEDPEVRQIKLQAAAAGEISRETAYRSIFVDYTYERQKRIEEDQEEAELLAKASKEQEDRDINTMATQTAPAGEEVLMQEEMAQGGMMPGAEGGAPPAPGGGGMPPAAPPAGGVGAAGPATLEELMAQADQIAQQLFTLPLSERRSRLVELKDTDETLHAQVKQRLTDIEQQAEFQGLQAARAGQMPMQ